MIMVHDHDMYNIYIYTYTGTLETHVQLVGLLHTQAKWQAPWSARGRPAVGPRSARGRPAVGPRSARGRYD
jgi:hypothetical protein